MAAHRIRFWGNDEPITNSATHLTLMHMEGTEHPGCIHITHCSPNICFPWGVKSGWQRTILKVGSFADEPKLRLRVRPFTTNSLMPMVLDSLASTNVNHRKACLPWCYLATPCIKQRWHSQRPTDGSDPPMF
ncbi:hypothetical protein VNO77_27171 [Canavalia gladiata]|uniref:Uncharacterized protein n=1 Tax=Canavalia gladiata TaxID=3824 RepID=A0AAN9KUA0_CANGL